LSLKTVCFTVESRLVRRNDRLVGFLRKKFGT
jgi:hypothetical protein